VNSWPSGLYEYGDWFVTHTISGANNDQELRKALEFSTVQILAVGFKKN
jgi:hypothetical protein